MMTQIRREEVEVELQLTTTMNEKLRPLVENKKGKAASKTIRGTKIEFI